MGSKMKILILLSLISLGSAAIYQNFGSGGIGSTNYYGGGSNSWGYSYPSFHAPLNPFAYSGFPFFWYPNNFWTSHSTYPWGSNSTSSSPTTSSSTFNNYGSGGSGSMNYYSEDDEQSGETSSTFPTSSSTFSTSSSGATYSNYGSGGIGSTNFF